MQFPKKNYLIQCIQSPLTLSAMQLYSLFFCKLNKMTVTNNQSVDIKAAEVRDIYSYGADGHFYQKIADACLELGNMKILCWPKGENQPCKKEIFQSVSYDNGVIRFIVNNQISQYFTEIDKGFTVIRLDLICQLKSPSTIRLYELLRSKAFTPKGISSNDCFEIEFGLNELRFLVGTADPMTDENVIAHLLQPGGPDFDAAWDNLPSGARKYTDWRAFKKRILDPACQNITRSTDIQVSYTTSGYGRGGRIYKICFYVSYKKHKRRTELIQDKIDTTCQPERTPKNDFSEEEISCVISEMKNRTGLNISESEALVILKSKEEHNITINELKSYFEVLSGKKNLRNPIGYLLWAIKNGVKSAAPEGPEKEQPFMTRGNYITPELEKFLLTTRPG